MSDVPYTCPLIDEIIKTLKFKCNHHTQKIGDYWVSMQDFRYDTIKEVIGELEELREMNKALRYDASYWKKLAEYYRTGIEEFNPEVLPKS